MRFDTEHGIQALYEAAQGHYREHWFSTVRRDFVADPQLINPPREFKLDTTFVVSNSLLDPHAKQSATVGTQ
jgi:hypothetical protein